MKITSCLVLSALERTKSLLLICLLRKICVYKVFAFSNSFLARSSSKGKNCLNHLRCIFSDFKSSLHTTSFISAPFDLNKNQQAKLLGILPKTLTPMNQPKESF